MSEPLEIDIVARQPELAELDDAFPEQDPNRDFGEKYLELRGRLTVDLGRVYDESPRSAIGAVGQLLYNVGTANIILGEENTREILDEKLRAECMDAFVDLSFCLNGGERPDKEIPFATNNLRAAYNNIAKYMMQGADEPREEEKLQLAKVVPPLVTCLDTLYFDRTNRAAIQMLCGDPENKPVLQRLDCNFDNALELLTVEPHDWEEN